jgi:dTDP-4-dehydrorhamnose 3,5-epimerase
MQFLSTNLHDACLIRLEPAHDNRGFFARSFCVAEFAAHGLETILDVIIDIRPDSPTYRHWQQFELTPDNGHQLYIPKGFAHGFQTLSDDVEVNYLISAPYKPEFARGIRYNEPAFAISWPLPVTEISEKDLHWPDFSP